MTDPNPDEGPLLELRGALDALDHELLELLVRRMDIVADIAARKRSHRVRIRDWVGVPAYDRSFALRPDRKRGNGGWYLVGRVRVDGLRWRYPVGR